MVKVGHGEDLFLAHDPHGLFAELEAWSTETTPARAAYSVPGSPVACTATRLPTRAASSTAARSSASVYW
jgi:hypothetical protein